MRDIKVLILDDSGERLQAFDELLTGAVSKFFATTAEQAIAMLDTATEFDIVFLDHDLGGDAKVDGGPGTGYEVACWLEEHPDKMPGKVVVHSMNPVGARKMMQAIPGTVYAPGAWATRDAIERLVEGAKR